MVIGPAVVGVVALERLLELAVSRRNRRAALARGGVESGRGHYVVMTLFHTAFLAACIVEPLLVTRTVSGWLICVSIVALLAAQWLRWWAITTLGVRWNTRIIVVPGDAPVTSGPYRWLRHPNYVAVIIEMIALPLLQGAWITAIVASIANALLLRTRIAAEERALGAAWQQAFARTPRFVPSGDHAGS